MCGKIFSGKLFIVDLKFGATLSTSVFVFIYSVGPSSITCFMHLLLVNRCDRFCSDIYSVLVALTITCA